MERPPEDHPAGFFFPVPADYCGANASLPNVTARLFTEVFHCICHGAQSRNSISDFNTITIISGDKESAEKGERPRHPIRPAAREQHQQENQVHGDEHAGVKRDGPWLFPNRAGVRHGGRNAHFRRLDVTKF
ncbi:hypothetical protein [Pseudorhodoplanes sp.]|uniref:hypothetical protein n=1 Tax=Pseudorhodoplanes sp. TaxID=1934341 RepID=UPI00391D7B63